MYKVCSAFLFFLDTVPLDVEGISLYGFIKRFI